MPTIRQQIIEMLKEDELNAIDISQMVSVREKEVYEHLAHISRSLKAKSQKLLIDPYCCLSCGYVFNTDFHSRSNRQSNTPIKRSRLSPRFYRKAMELETVFVIFPLLLIQGYELFF